MHLSYEELLDVRDGGAGPVAESHVAACPACAAEVERLRKVAAALRALPVEEPPWDRWPAVRRALVERQRRRRFVYAGYAALALAASFALALILPRLSRTLSSPLPGVPGAGAPEIAAARDAESEDLDRLIRESQRLEALLRRMGSDPGVVDMRAASTVVSLQDEIAWVDHALASPAAARAPKAEVRKLWQERVDLMNRLVRAREGRPVYVDL